MNKRKSILNKIVIALGSVILFVALLLTYFTIGEKTALGFERYVPNYDKMDITPILQKDALSNDDYDIVYAQTGLTRLGVDALLDNGDINKILEIQDAYFTSYEIADEKFGPFCHYYYLGGKNGSIPITELKNGDIIISSSTEFSWWSFGHCAMVVDAEKGIIAEAVGYGQESGTNHIYTVQERADFMVLRPNIEQELLDQIVEYVRTEMMGLDYDATIGVLSQKYPGNVNATQCAHIFWYAFFEHGINIDSNGGTVVTPKDIANSEHFDLVQVSGFDPQVLWSDNGDFMLINYGSFMYFTYISIAVGLCIGLYFILRNKSERVKRTVVVIIACLNLAQHILKPLIYPHYRGSFYGYLSSAYNVCAFLIIASPFIWLFGNELFKNFMSYVGSIAGMIAMLVPYWFIGQTAFQPEAYRFYLCHTLLFLSSILPALLRMHKLRWKHFWKIGLLFFVMLTIILLNDIIFIKMGQYPVSNPDDLYGSLCEINPCWSMMPPPNANFDWLMKIIGFLSPPFLRGQNSAGLYVPILWYAIPMYIGITLATFVVCVFVDFKSFRADIARLKGKLKKKKE